MRRIVCIGDAVTHGARATRGYPEHLWEQLRDTRPLIVHNAGLREGGLVDVLRAIPSVSTTFRNATLAVLLVPPYDAKGSGANPREHRLLLEQTVELALGCFGGLVLCSPTPIGDSATVRGFGRPSRRWIPKAAEITEEVARDHELHFVPLHKMDRALLADSVHPRPEGYRWIASQLAPVIRDLAQ